MGQTATLDIMVKRKKSLSLMETEPQLQQVDTGRSGKEATVIYFKVVSWYLPGGTEENIKKPVVIHITPSKI